jgi:ketosteroid isomerase-like protein
MADDSSRLRELEDKAEIADIINRYGDGVLRGDAEIITSCFGDDAVLDHGHGQTVNGRDAILAYFSNAGESPSGKAVLTFDQKVGSSPVMSNILIELDGDTAHCESTCLAIHYGFTAGEGKVIIRGTRNIDDLARTPQGWKITHRVHPAQWKIEVPGTPIVEG